MIYDSCMKEHALWPGGPRYAGEPFGLDALALAAFAAPLARGRCCDLGCGSGILTLLLSYSAPEAELIGIELRENAAEECRRNLARNGLAARCRVVTGNWMAVGPEAGSVELAVCNPPYFPAGGAVSPDPDRAGIRTETVPLRDLCARAAELLRHGGNFCLVHRTERLPEVLRELAGAGLEPKELRMIASRAEAAPELFLCRAKKGAHPGLRVSPPLLQFGPDGRESEEYRTITHWEA